MRTLEKFALIRWFKGSLPGRISAVFLLAATVTVLGLLYATPRLEQSLVAPREKSVETTLNLGVALIKARQYGEQTITSADGVPTVQQVPIPANQFPTLLAQVFGLGSGFAGVNLFATGNERVALYQVSGDPKDPTVTKLAGSEPASPVVHQAAESPYERITELVTVGGISRVQSAQAVALKSGETVVFTAWQDIEDIERTVEIARRRILIAGIGGASVALLLGVWVTTRLTRRIRLLEAGARKVARGDFTATFPHEGSLELSSLARALDEMQSQLAELETARRRFIATASHELRTPLSTLQGFLELLEDEDIDPVRRHEFVMHASQQAQRLGKLASDLLDLSRLDVGSVKVRLAPVDVGLLLEGLVMEFRMKSEETGHALTRSVDTRAETAVIDGDRVLQLLRALVDNAFTHTPEGTPVQLGATRHGQRVEFTVSDQGPGIPAAMQREMFEAFVTSDETRGSGLGLAISRELARRMQGDLTVTSVPGSTVFTLSLPA